MKVLIKLLALFLILSSFCIFISRKFWIEIPIINEILGNWLYENVYIVTIVINIILIMCLLFKKDLSKKEKEYYIFGVISIPFYNIYIILKKL